MRAPSVLRFLPDLVLLLAVVSVAACSGGGGGGGGSNRTPTPTPTPVDNSVVQQLQQDLANLTPSQFLDTSARALMARDPDLLVELGMESPDDPPRLTDLSYEYHSITVEMAGVILAAMNGYDPGQLSEETRRHFSIYRWYLEDMRSAQAYRLHTYPVSASIASLEQRTLIFFTEIHPLESETDAERYLDRLSQLGLRLAQIEDQLRARSDAGFVPPRFVLQRAAWAIEGIAHLSADETPYYTALRGKLVALQPRLAAETQLLASARRSIDQVVLPAYRSLSLYVRQLISSAPPGVGVNQYQGGDEYYSYLLQHHTTTDLTAAEVHQLGLDQLARIHAEMAERFAALGYPPDESLVVAFNRVTSDGGVVISNNIAARFEQLIQGAWSRLPEAFSTIPSQEVVVIGVGSGGGFYIAGSLDGSRPGAFYASIRGTEPAYEMRSLAYHETVPGHHLQIALAQELDLPRFTLLTSFTSFVEGWALYAERLAYDLGWFDSDPYGDLGRLQWEALRASRLVVETGLHYYGWSYDRAVVQLREDTGFSLDFCEGQIARYIAMPGQATAYMIGMLAFLDARTQVQSAQGDQFDLRAFHDLVLNHGDMPLSVLGEQIDAYLQAPGG